MTKKTARSQPAPATVAPVRRRPAPAAVAAAVTAQLRQPGAVLGPRASRTITTILEATRHIFQVRGYAGTIDEIATEAGISRGSFYTYFPSKRDVLLTLGGQTVHAARQAVEALADLPADWQPSDLERWVGKYFEMLDQHGSFVFAWTQAAQEDDEIRVAGMNGHLELCRRMGQALASLGHTRRRDPVESGLVAFSLLERGWAYWQLYAGAVDQARLQRAMARTLAASVR